MIPPPPPKGNPAPPPRAHKNSLRPDWPQLLHRYLAARAQLPFDWAHNTCCHLASGWVYHRTGLEVAPELFAQATSLLTAKRLLARKGGVGGLVSRAAHRHGWPQVSRSYARRGDLVLFKDQDGQCAVGICCGDTLAAVGAGGLEYLPMRAATHAFQID